MRYSAKERLLEQKNVAHQHLDVVSSESFLRAAEAALLEMVMNAPEGVAGVDALAEYHKIVGAKKYLQLLINIAEPPKPLPEKPNYGLDRNTK